MSNTKKIMVKIPAELVSKIDELVEQGVFTSRADAIKSAVVLIINEYSLRTSAERSEVGNRRNSMSSNKMFTCRGKLISFSEVYKRFLQYLYELAKTSRGTSITIVPGKWLREVCDNSYPFIVKFMVYKLMETGCVQLLINSRFIKVVLSRDCVLESLRTRGKSVVQ